MSNHEEILALQRADLYKELQKCWQQNLHNSHYLTRLLDLLYAKDNHDDKDNPYAPSILCIMRFSLSQRPSIKDLYRILLLDDLYQSLLELSICPGNFAVAAWDYVVCHGGVQPQFDYSPYIKFEAHSDEAQAVFNRLIPCLISRLKVFYG